MAKKNDWKRREGVVYSTNPSFDYSFKDQLKGPGFSKDEEELHVRLETKGRAGKQATLVYNFQGTNQDLKKLEKLLKAKCGVGGSSKDDQILIQGNHVNKVMDILSAEGYAVKKTGG